LGLYPALIGLKEVGTNSYDALLKFIASNSLDTSVLIKPNQFETIDHIKEDLPMFVFGSNIEEQLILMREDPPEFIPISYPNNGRTLLTMRPLIGFHGVLTLVEDVLNSFRHYHSIRKNLPL
jgi:nitrogenase molybdenum-iron protein alpha/beta subunit